MASSIRGSFAAISNSMETSASLALQDIHAAYALQHHLNESRKISLGVLVAILAYLFQAERTQTAGWVICLILYTMSHGWLYGVVDVNVLKARIKTTGPTVFVALNSIPHIAIATFVMAEMMRVSATAGEVVMQILVVASPVLLWAIAAARKRQRLPVRRWRTSTWEYASGETAASSLSALGNAVTPPEAAVTRT